MTVVFVDATTLIALGRLGELDLLSTFEGPPVVLPAVEAEVTTEPARTNVRRFRERDDVVGPADVPFPAGRMDDAEGSSDAVAEAVRVALELLGDDNYDGDVELVATVLVETGHAEGRPGRVGHGSDEAGCDGVGVVSDDRRVRTVTRGLGATVTGTVGVVVRAVEDGRLTADEATTLVRRLDGGGLHMTAELRERSIELVQDAASGRER